ncbi:restriction endonuclease subunit S [Actinomadura bangladeshensis]|uniref:Type I restriction modification DNA specificity domain-containing protein n=1 Tax=Actinomadura bangladeshensis TaxID=453573 RepID=A0A6L9QWA8_9ACTN|nr:restriction endonuclease subunit S [Actinomadura bangladeshensis]NEA29496.1 hypothetical protein [Actinomadura bangladeshensis]
MRELFRYPRIPAVEMERVAIDATNSERFLLRKYDLLFARRSLTAEGAGKCSVVIEVDEPSTWESSIIRARIDPRKGNAQYYYYYFRSPQGRAAIESIVEQVAAAGIRSSDLAKLQVPTPDLRYQAKIVGLLSSLDDKVAVNDHIVRTVRGMGDALVRATIAEAENVSIQDLIDGGDLSIGDGYRTKRAELGEPGLPILRVAEVQDGYISPRHDDFVRAEFRGKIGAKSSSSRDVILTTKGTVGRVAIIPDDFPEHVYSPQVCYFRVVESGRLSASYLFYWFRSESFRQQALPLQRKTDMADYLNLADIKSLRIPVPDPRSAEGLLEKLEALEAGVDRRLREVETLVKLRDALLPKLMSGQVRIRDAEKVVEDAV